MDIRQSPMWGDYLTQIGWKVEKVGSDQAFVRHLPLFSRSIIKIQRPKNPVPFKEIDKLARKNRALFVLVEPEINHYDPVDFKTHGFKPSYMTLTHTSTIQVDLTQPENQLYKNLSENAKRNLKKAGKNNLKVKYYPLNHKQSAQLFDQFNELQKSLTQIRKFWQPGKEEMGKKGQAFKQSSALLLAYQPNDDQPIAGIWIGFFKDRTFYMHVGATPTGYQTLANYLLVWEGIKKAKSLGFKIWDFEGIYDPRFPRDRKKWKGFSQFKSRFHGNLVEYPSPWIKIYYPPFKVFYLISKFFN